MDLTFQKSLLTLTIDCTSVSWLPLFLSVVIPLSPEPSSTYCARTSSKASRASSSAFSADDTASSFAFSSSWRDVIFCLAIANILSASSRNMEAFEASNDRAYSSLPSKTSSSSFSALNCLTLASISRARLAIVPSFSSRSRLSAFPAST